MIWLAQWEKACPKAENRDSPVVEREKSTCAGLGLAVTHGERAGLEINLPPLEKANL